MKQSLVILAVVVVAAPATAAIDRSNAPLFPAAASPLDVGQLGLNADYNGVAYSNMSLAGPNYYVDGTAGIVSSDDYASIVTAPDTILMKYFRFVGGVANPDEVLFFDFYDTGGTYVTSFGVQLPDGGPYNWGVTITTPFAVPNAGRCDMWADDGSVITVSTGHWYLNAEVPTIGTTDPTYPGHTDGVGNYLDHKFEIESIPEPASVVLLALGAVVAFRRR
jgi:hypothetical protein